MQLRDQDFDLQAGASRTLYIEGNFVFFKDATGADKRLRLRAAGGIDVELRPGQSLRVPANVEELQIVNMTAGQLVGVLVIGDGEFFSALVTGAVTIDGVAQVSVQGTVPVSLAGTLPVSVQGVPTVDQLADTTAGTVFSSRNSNPASGAVWCISALKNTSAGPAKTLLVDDIYLFNETAAEKLYYIGVGNADLAGFGAGPTPASKVDGQAVADVQSQFVNNGAAGPSTLMRVVSSISVPANQGVWYSPRDPIQVPSGHLLIVGPGLAGTYCVADIHFRLR